MCGELNVYRQHTLGADVALTHIRVGLLGQVPSAATQDDQVAKLSFPKSSATSADIMAWEKAGYKGSLKDFMKNRKVKTNGESG